MFISLWDFSLSPSWIGRINWRSLDPLNCQWNIYSTTLYALRVYLSLDIFLNPWLIRLVNLPDWLIDVLTGFSFDQQHNKKEYISSLTLKWIQAWFYLKLLRPGFCLCLTTNWNDAKLPAASLYGCKSRLITANCSKVSVLMKGLRYRIQVFHCYESTTLLIYVCTTAEECIWKINSTKTSSTSLNDEARITRKTWNSTAGKTRLECNRILFQSFPLFCGVSGVWNVTFSSSPRFFSFSVLLPLLSFRGLLNAKGSHFNFSRTFSPAGNRLLIQQVK